MPGLDTVNEHGDTPLIAALSSGLIWLAELILETDEGKKTGNLFIYFYVRTIPVPFLNGRSHSALHWLCVRHNWINTSFTINESPPRADPQEIPRPSFLNPETVFQSLPPLTFGRKRKRLSEFVDYLAENKPEILDMEQEGERTNGNTSNNLEGNLIENFLFGKSRKKSKKEKTFELEIGPEDVSWLVIVVTLVVTYS